ncbi:MAG: 30S ribosomal protein S5 [Candidatus Peregrinibacteria bacterium]
MLDIARVTRVVKGGRRLRFRATVAIGDKKGRVGVGTGKSAEVATSIRKAVSDAKKNLITVDLIEGTIPHDLKMKYKSAAMLLMPAPSGTGVIAGGAFRKIAILAGITDVFAKSHGTSNALVSAQASIRALSGFTPRRKKRVVETEKDVA